MKHQKTTYAGPAIVNIFLPGVGQMMKGQVGSGLLILIAVIICALLSWLVVPGIIGTIIWIWAIISAYTKPAKY